MDIVNVCVREKGLEVYSLMILSSLALALTVDAHNDFGEETSRPEGGKLPWFTYEIIIKQVIKNALIEVLFTAVSFFLLF